MDLGGHGRLVHTQNAGDLDCLPPHLHLNHLGLPGRLSIAIANVFLPEGGDKDKPLVFQY